jgi:2'-hydroxyisoflavone reductase
VQVVDSRDLAALCVRLLEDDRPGAFNAVGPATPVTLAGLVRTCAEAAGTTAEPVPVPPVEREQGFPLVLDDPGTDGLFRVSRAAAEAAGLGSTPLATTARDTAAWDADRGCPPIPRAFTPEQEDAALRATAG